jgi:hypothetical protein
MERSSVSYRCLVRTRSSCSSIYLVTAAMVVLAATVPIVVQLLVLVGLGNGWLRNQHLYSAKALTLAQMCVLRREDLAAVER